MRKARKKSEKENSSPSERSNKLIFRMGYYKKATTRFKYTSMIQYVCIYLVISVLLFILSDTREYEARDNVDKITIIIPLETRKIGRKVEKRVD